MATLKDKFINTIKGAGQGLARGITTGIPGAGVVGAGVGAFKANTQPVQTTQNKIATLTAPKSTQVSKPITPNGATAPTPTKINAPTTPSLYSSSIGSTPKDMFINNLSNQSSVSTQQTTPTEPTPVTTPQPSATDTAFAEYIKFLKPSAKYTEAKSAYNTAVADQAKTYAGFEGQGRGIPTSIVRGTQEKYLRQTQPELERLQNEAALAQDEQRGYQDVAKAGLDFALAKEKTANELNKKEGFSLGKDQVRYEFNSKTGQYEQIGGGISTPVSTIYQEGVNPTVDSYIKGIKNNTLKISDVPDQYKDLVAQGINTKTSQISDSGKEVLGIVDTLLSNPQLSRISGTIDQALGGFVNSDAKLAKNYYNQLVGILKLDNRQKLKGSGAISDFEFRVLGEAATALGRNLSDDAFRNELQKIKDKLSGNSPIPATPTDGDVWKSPEGIEFEFKNGYWEELGQSFSSVGKTTASNIPQKNKNPGNVKQGGIADRLAIGVDNQGHLIFPDEQTGFEAMKLDIQAKVNGQSKYLPPNPTIAQLGKVYAEDPNWGKKVASILGVPPTTSTKMIPINSLVQAIARQEGYYA